MTNTKKANIMFISAASIAISIISTACISFGSRLFPCTMAEQWPCCIHNAVAVTGGGLDASATVANGYAWILKTTELNGKHFAEIRLMHRRCKAYLGNNFQMVECIKRLRYEKVLQLMYAHEHDPNHGEENAHDDDNISRYVHNKCKREMMDKTPPPHH